MSVTLDDFRPNWFSPPGDTIRDILNQKAIPQTELADELDVSNTFVTDLLEGRETITLSIAGNLNRFLGGSVEFWMSRDYQYREDAKRIDTENSEWLSEIPIGDMCKFGWLEVKPKPSEEFETCMQFFGTESTEEWHSLYGGIAETVAFRKSKSISSKLGSLACWLRQGEREASKIPCKSWDLDTFASSLVDIRKLTRQKDPTKFLSSLTEICSQCGIAFVLVRAPTGCGASGATRFSKNGKAIIQLSFRYLTDDHFWFTFFHEAGHLILHDSKNIFIEGLGEEINQVEQEANQFSAKILIPVEHQEEFNNLRATYKSVITFARKVGVSPGIVVGQLQFAQRIRFNQLNKLKRRFNWV